MRVLKQLFSTTFLTIKLLRRKIRLNEYDCIQPAGVCFDAGGNILLSDSKAAKIMLFDKNGDYCHDIDVVDKYGMSGYLKNENSLKTRLTDIAINDKEWFVC